MVAITQSPKVDFKDYIPVIMNLRRRGHRDKAGWRALPRKGPQLGCWSRNSLEKDKKKLLKI